jgi:UDP-N-acetylglucosamine 2-epimerase (non-hydrolysing)
MKVLTLVGTRPEIIKLSRVIALLEREVNHVLVHSGQNFDYELNEIFLEEFGLRPPDYYLNAGGGSAIETICGVLSGLDRVLATESPDAVLVYGDTNTCLGVISAKRRQIPIFHMEAGNRCFDERVPEEMNRRIVDHVSDINMTNSENARRNLLAEGLPPDRVFNIGSPMAEVLKHYGRRVDESRILDKLGLEPGKYLVVSAHREENVDAPERLELLIEGVRLVAHVYNRRVIVSAHPRLRARLAALDEEAVGALDILRPFGFFDYIRLQKESFCVISDSGTLSEEAALLSFPAVMLREAHERPEGTDAGVTILAGIGPDRVVEAVGCAVSLGGPDGLVRDYKDAGSVSRKVVRLILGYVDYVNRVVWQKGRRV